MASSAVVIYALTQRFRYAYPEPIRDLRHHLMIVPPDTYGHQQVLALALDITNGVEVTKTTDQFGNLRLDLTAARLDGVLEIEMRAVLTRDANSVVLLSNTDPSIYRRSSRLTHPDASLRAAAASLRASCPTGEDLATHIRRHVHTHMRYAFDVTTVRTTAAEAYAGAAGLCQDYAHVMIALCRAVGIPARYVSGHLVAEGGSHAWVETFHQNSDRGFTVRGHDPTNDCLAARNHVFIAAGRDYADVPPTTGTYEGECLGTFESSRSLEPVNPSSTHQAAA
jgi:transglutaminase-like putative cysteine protease